MANESPEARAEWLGQMRDRIIKQRGLATLAADLQQAKSDKLLDLLPSLITNPQLASVVAAARETITLIIQERIANDLSRASDRVARAGNLLACVGVLVMLAQLVVAFLTFSGKE